MPDLLILLREHKEGKVSAIDSGMIDALVQAGFQPRLCITVKEVWAEIAGTNNRIIVIDNCDDEAEGHALVAGFRASFSGGIVLFSETASGDCACGLNSGADIVLSLSNSQAEVVAYLYALKRRMAVQNGIAGSKGRVCGK